MGMRKVIYGVAAVAWAAMGAAPALAGGFTAADIQLLYGSDMGDLKEYNGKPFAMWTFEVANGWTYGDNFFFTDWNKGPTYDKNDAIAAYSELHSRLSASKITGSTVGGGPISDLLLATEIDLPSGFSPAYMYGLGVDLKIPGFAYAFVNFFVRDELGADGVSYQINPVWMVPFGFGPIKGNFNGWIDIMTGEGKGQEMWWQAQPTLLIDIANFWGAPGKLLAGCEYEYFHNFLGFTKKDINHPQFVAFWNL